MDYKVVIDAGHGGVDGGASGNGILEKNLTLQISEEMLKDFERAGIPVKMTRMSDETLTPTERVNRILEAFGNDENVIVISNHINAGGVDNQYVVNCITIRAEKIKLLVGKMCINSKIKLEFCVYTFFYN